MNPNKESHLAKTLVHGKGAGEVGSADLEQRAREIALIAGHDPANPWPEDRQQARAEFEGRSLPDTASEDAQSIGSITRDPSDPPAFIDGAKPNIMEPNEQEELEHLVLDGVEEAQHDQMLEARKRRKE